MKTLSYLILTTMTLTLLSCDFRKKIKTYDVVQHVYNGTDFSINFNFPDTLYRDSSYLGAIFYNNEIDSVNNMLNDSISREISLIYKLGKNNTPISDVELEKNTQSFDTMYGFIKDTKIIFANDFNFQESGVNYINGVVLDDTYIKMDSEKVRVINKKYRVLHKLYVIDQ